MATAQQILAASAKELGYDRFKDPEQGTKYGRWYADLVGVPWFGTNGVAWCAMYQSYIFAGLGQAAPGLPTAGCGDVRRAAIEYKRVVNKYDARPGDLVLFRWDGNVDDLSYSDHIGLVEINLGHALQTHEGNTNNGKVARRVRAWKYVQMVIRPVYDGEQASALPAKLEVDGIWGMATTLRAQEYFGLEHRDSIVSRQNPKQKWCLGCAGTGWEFVEPDGEKPGSPLIRAIQLACGMSEKEADGIFGPNTANHFIEHFMPWSGATQLDSKLDYKSISVKAMQRRLNEGAF